MQASNPYTAPRSDAPEDTAYGEVRVFSARGRIGRARYVAYSIGLALLISLTMGVVIGLSGPSPDAAKQLPVLAVGYGLILIIHAFLSIQRAHDFGASGWLAIAAFVPLVNLLFWFIPGTTGANRFGPRPPPNGWGALVLACLLPLLFAIGVIAAIALPIYSQYVQQAQSQPR